MAKEREDWGSTYIEALRENGNISAACRAVGIARSTAYRRREADEEFAALWDDALEDACDALEKEAWRRAVEGTDKPITYQGVVRDTYKEYSDTLLIFLLKAHRPDKYRETRDIKLSGEVGVKAYIGISPDAWDEDE